MRRSILLFIMIVSTVFLASCATSQNVVAEFGNNEVTYDELKEAYYKNLSAEERESENVDEGMKDFLELYVNFKMKLRDAQVRGFEQDPELQQEIEDYTKTVGVPYVEEKFIIEPGLRKLYEQRKIEKRVSHILLRTEGKDVDSVMQLANNLIERIRNGEDFGKLAEEYSEDQFSKNSGGDIYWLTAGQTVPEFDDAIYKTNKGEVYPEPIKTQFGIHILKVVDEQPRKYEVKAQHILAGFRQENGQIDTAAAMEKIKLVQSKLEEGIPFEELAAEYSDDPGSKNNGGNLGYFQRRMMVLPFDEAAFSLKHGEISGIIETKFGYHIIKVNDIKELPPYEVEKEKLKQLYQSRLYKTDREKYVDSLKSELNFQLNENIYEQFRDKSSNAKFDSSYWESDIEKNIGDSTLFAIAGKQFTVNDFVKLASEENSYVGTRMTNGNIEKAVNEIVAKNLLIEKAFQLKEGNTEFAKLMDDYKNGLYIFKLQEDEIWNKITVDTTQLPAIYEETKENYVWPDRAAFNVIYRADSASIYSDKQLLDSGTPFETIILTNKKDLKLNNKNKRHVLREIKGDKIAEKAFSLEKPGDISEPFKVGNGWYIVQLTEKEPSRLKTYEEAQSELIDIWQERQSKKLEEKYIQRLRKLYEPELYYDRLAEIQKK